MGLALNISLAVKSLTMFAILHFVCYAMREWTLSSWRHQTLVALMVRMLERLAGNFLFFCPWCTNFSLNYWIFIWRNCGLDSSLSCRHFTPTSLSGLRSVSHAPMEAMQWLQHMVVVYHTRAPLAATWKLGAHLKQGSAHALSWSESKWSELYTSNVCIV